MNIITLILLSQFVFINGGDRNSESSKCPSQLHDELAFIKQDDLSLPLKNVKMKIVASGNLRSLIDLKQTKRMLANKFLPVWILKKAINTKSLDQVNGDELERDYQVMNQLGEFTAYQDSETSSAAIYFHKRREFNGMIACQYAINKLSIDEFDAKYRGNKPDSDIYRSSICEIESFLKDKVVEDPAAGINIQNHLQTFEGRLYDGYPEVLVIVSWELAQSLTKHVSESERYTKIISYVLTLYNGVDMLYSKLQKVKIQVNIAGIIIGTERKSFDYLTDCYYVEEGRVKKNARYKKIAGCVNSKLQIFLEARKRTIPINSYDTVMFLTEERLYGLVDVGNNKKKACYTEGVSSVIHELYECRKVQGETILVASLTPHKHFQNYPTIAHELAHLMTVFHDKPPVFTADGQCCGNIMKTSGHWCGKCTSWSEISEESFRLFFSSPNCCTFINKPRSLYPPGRQLMLTGNQQCQCYGYKSAKELYDVLHNFCGEKLQCLGTDNEIHLTVIPMEGTPCDNNKVCWDGHCQPFEFINRL